jgi:catechol 2,3-dioxygenase-like lactoylglutathione lyase family enzyme
MLKNDHRAASLQEGSYSEPMLDHLSIQCADVAASAAFYDAVLAPLGAERVIDLGEVIGYGIAQQADFWIAPRSTGQGFRESHIAFGATDRAAVRAFFEAGVAHGAEVLHEPQLWPQYDADYYGAFLRDPDGNNVEAVSHGPQEGEDATVSTR